MLPADASEVDVQRAAARASETSGPLRDALYTVLQEAVLLGTETGRVQTESVLGVGRKALPVEVPDPLVSFAVDWTLVNSEAQQWALGQVGTLLDGLNATTSTAVSRAVAAWIGTGQPLSDLRSQIRALFGRRAEAIAVTEVTRAYAEGNRLAWDEGGIITTMEWRTANDELVCPLCGPMSGRQAPVKAGFSPNPPLHTRCRCWIVPVV